MTIQNYYRLNEIIEDGIGYRSPYRRDYARIIHCASFRRLEKKTQLFPGQESDFFRNRLTHSLEVAQIAKTIAIKFNKMQGVDFIEPDICEIAGLIHDIGHPPFGHNGEKALDDCMKSCGGFEGNAQTLHIITGLEKKEIDDDNKYGLNLTVRSIASALKYDEEIPIYRDANAGLVKGYYACDKEVVDIVKEKLNFEKTLSSGKAKVKFKTIECTVMDLADDIAYSTYDIEDAFKAGFLTPFEIIAASDEIYKQIIEKLKKDEIEIEIKECRELMLELLSQVWKNQLIKQKTIEPTSAEFDNSTINNFIDAYKSSKQWALNGYKRTKLTSFLVNKFIEGIKLEYDVTNPILSKIKFDDKTLKMVNILKHFTYVCLINSPRLKVAESRGYDIVTRVFNKLVNDNGYKFMPEDFQQMYNKKIIIYIEKKGILTKEEKDIPDTEKKRIICDFIAGMTDRYLLEFYCRLFSENAQTIFKPL